MSFKSTKSFIRELIYSRLERPQSRLATLTLCLFNLFGMLLFIAINEPIYPYLPIVLSAVFGAIFSALLFWPRIADSQKAISFIFIANTTIIVLALYLVSPYFAEQVPNWVPFRPSKLGCLVAATLAPTFISGIYAVTIHFLIPTLQYFSFTESIRNNIVGGEPASLYAFGMAGFFIIIFRFRKLLFERKLNRLVQEKAAIQAVATHFLHLRDLMNTPLQTLTLTVEQFSQETSNKKLIDRCQRSLHDLKMINQTLKKYENEIDWAAIETPK